LYSAFFLLQENNSGIKTFVNWYLCNKNWFMQQGVVVFILMAGLMLSKGVYADKTTGRIQQEADTIAETGIIFTPEMAHAYLIRLLNMEDLWRNDGDTLRNAINILTEHYKEPFDSISRRLRLFSYDSVWFEPAVMVQQDTFPLRWLSDSLFYIDTVRLDKAPLFTQKTIVHRTMLPDSAMLLALDTLPDLKAIIDSVLQVSDTMTGVFIDYEYLQSRNIRLYKLTEEGVDPPLLDRWSDKRAVFTPDSSAVVFSSTKHVLMADQDSPFYIVPDTTLPDSLRFAVETILDYTHKRDSILLSISDLQGRSTPFWLTAGTSDLYRYWLKNSKNDSITIWLGNPSKFNLSLILEEGVIVERLEKIPVDDVPIATAKPDRTLAEIKPLQEIPVFWKYNLAGSFTLNQNYLTYWAQGGESSFSGMLDIGGTAKYTNKETKSEWSNRVRLRYGALNTKEQGYRVSTDILEMNSQYNKVLISKLDFSSIFYFKSQLTKGYNYPNDSVTISKFLNPGTFTIGMGVEYKPFAKTLLNFSALSYKNTFVLDTNSIDQTNHGVETGKRSRQEVGGQLVINNTVSVFDGLKITNAVRLFSNYIEKPQNLDVDWETTLERQINWFFSVKLNLHLIYDDDVMFPVTKDDGAERKVPRTQFNQFFGLSLSVRL
jgi:hypothetical protein